MSGAPGNQCVFCQIARSSTSTTLLHSVRSDPSAYISPPPPSQPRFLSNQFSKSSLSSTLDNSRTRRSPRSKTSTRRHSDHIATVKDLQRNTEDYELVNHMLNVGQTLLQRDAPQSKLYRFGFHRPPFNSVNHLHLHCLALPFVPRWKSIKYTSFGPLGGFIEAEEMLEKIRPSAAM